MKKQINQRPQSLLLAAIVGIFLFGAGSSVFAQQGIGARYGARDPRTCADTKNPTSGAISAEQATKYVISNLEHQFGENLYLVENVKVEIGGSRPYNAYTDSGAADIDTTAPVYPIRGSFDQYQCAPISKLYPNNGRNCTLYHMRKAEGKCYKTTFGDWCCTMLDLSSNRNDVEPNVAPPGGSVTAPENKSADKSDNRTAETKADAEEFSYPKPDFSEMQKYFEITKDNYDVTGGKLYFLAQMTKKNNAVSWNIDFYDADGLKVIDTNGVTVASGDHSEVGDRAKYFFYLPAESTMKRVKKVVITRRIN
jgi:hypothetical protein